MVGENIVWMFLPWWWVRIWSGLFTLMMGENMVWTFYLDGGWEYDWDFLPWLWVRIFTLMMGENFYLDGGWEYDWDFLPWWRMRTWFGCFYLDGGWEHDWDFLPWWWVRTWFGCFYLDGGWEHGLDVFTLMVGENMVWTLCCSRGGRGSFRMSFSFRIQIWMTLWQRNCRGGTFFITHATWRLNPAATNKRRSLWPQQSAVRGLPCKI